MAEPARRRSGWRRVRHRLRPLLARPLVWLGAKILPPLYVAYMNFVWRTSSVETNDFERGHEIVRKYGGAVSLVLHQDVLLSGYGVARLGFPMHTLASVGDAGEIVTRALERCGYTVFRGGSASRASRRRLGVVRSMIRHMQENEGVIYGITVDGSKGPVYEMKDGGIAIARACGKPVVVCRIWSSRALRLSTWDRTAVPLPFGRIDAKFEGPFLPPDDSQGEVAAERFRLERERDLIDLAARSHDLFGEPRPAELSAAAERNARALRALGSDT